jgi:activator of HSP90 ATPase
MAKTIVQKVVFKNTTPKDLYDLYMNSKKHSKATAAPAQISAKEGAPFSAAGGYITGQNLKLVKDQLIVQSWRGKDWSKKDADSTFLIHLEPKGKNVVLHAVHTNIPDKQAEGIDKGWHTFYWEPWKQYLAGKPITKMPGM